MATTPSSVWRRIFYSRDVGRIFRVAEALEFCMVCVNSGILSTEVAPLVASSSRVWVARGPSTASTSIWRSSTFASLVCSAR